MRNTLLKATALSSAIALTAGAASAQTAEECVGALDSVNVIAQGMPSVLHVQDYLSEFDEKWGTEVQITLLGENERRAKSRLDVATGAGSYHVLYIDEANVAEMASRGWVHPLEDVVPAEYDLADFRVDLSNVATHEGVQYYAPFVGGGDLMMYRKDLLEEAGIETPGTLEDLVTAIKTMHDPSGRLYGWTARGQRGSGMNVWRWTPFFRAVGGEWRDGDMPVFNSAEGVEATEMYLDLMDYAPPGVGTFTWSDSVEAFRSGQVAFMIESDVLGLWAEDPEKSAVAGKVGYAPPPAPLPSAGWSHGFAVSAVGAPDGCAKLVAGDFVGWATSKEMEQRRLADGVFSDVGRTSTLESEAYRSKVPAEYLEALLETAPRTNLLIMASPAWPEIGDSLGLVLEELFTGTRDDVQGALDEAAFEAEDSLRRVR